MKRIRLGLAVSIVLLVAASWSTPVSAADNVVIRKVDTSSYPAVRLTVLRPPVASVNDPVKISENGKTVTNAQVQTFASASEPTGVVLAIDASTSMTDGAAIDKAKDAAIGMVRAKAPGQKFAVVAFNNTARPVVNLTDDTDLLVNGIEGISASGDSAMWDGIRMSASLLQNAGDLQPNVVVITGSQDSRSSVGVPAVQAALRTAKVVLFPVVVQQRAATNSDSLRVLAQATGGRFIQTNDPAATSPILSGLEQNLSDQALITYNSTTGAKALDISVGIGTGVATAHASPGTVAEGAEVTPEIVKGSNLPVWLTGTVGLVVIALISLAGAGLLLYGVAEILGKERHQLSRALRPYSDEPEVSDLSKLADSEIIKKAVAGTAKMAEDRGLLQMVQLRLEQADLPLKPAEAIFFTGVTAMVAMVLGLVLKGILGLALAGLLCGYMPIMITSLMAKRRKKKFTSQLPDTLQLLSGSLRAGYSLVQGLDAVSKQCDAPMGAELTRAMSEARLGRPVEDALQDISDRMGSDDFEWAVMAIKIQREVGGNLAELLMTVSETMVARERLRREVKALTAEGRMSAIILVALPPSIGALISFMNPDYMHPMFANTIGQYALVAAGFMMGIGYWLMNKLIQIEV